MTARQLEFARTHLKHRQARAREYVAVAVACAVLAPAATPFALPLGLALMIGAAAAVCGALINARARRNEIARLALDPSTYALAEVRGYGHRLVEPAEREKLAAWLRELVRDESTPGAMFLSERVSEHARQLELLARELTSPGLEIHPASAAACLHMLTDAAESPLYNPALPSHELGLMIERIRRGMTASRLPSDRSSARCERRHDLGSDQADHLEVSVVGRE
jgi:hypothetical protein